MTVDWQLLVGRIFAPGSAFLAAAQTTVLVAIAAQSLGTLAGFIGALATRSRSRLVRLLVRTYVVVMQGTPLVVQVFFIYYGVDLLLGFPLFPRELSVGPVSISGAVIAGTIALALNEGAFMTEIIRAGLGAVDKGHIEVATALGMSKALTMRTIVLPQAARIIMPAFGNEFNSMIKNTSLLAFIGVYEIFQDAQVGYAQTFKPVEYFLAVAVWYLALTTIWSAVQRRIESALARSERTPKVGRATALLTDREEGIRP